MNKPMKDFVNRKVTGYHFNRWTTVAELDRIASYVLALSWSRRCSPTPATQSLIQMDCVACVFVEGELWLASNSQAITSDDVTQLQTELGDNIPIYIVKNGKPHKMHAEMQILSQLYQERKQCDGNYIGVSKPCCQLCKKFLDEYRINYHSWHGSDVSNWEHPIDSLNFSNYGN